MATDDEPLDDARAVGTAAAAAAARVVEAVARDAREQAAQHRAAVERAHDQQRAQQTLVELRATIGADKPGGYDSPEQRQARDAVRGAAGLGEEVRQVRATADLMNGTDPAAAAQGKVTPRAEFAKRVTAKRQASRTR